MLQKQCGVKNYQKVWFHWTGKKLSIWYYSDSFIISQGKLFIFYSLHNYTFKLVWYVDAFRASLVSDFCFDCNNCSLIAGPQKDVKINIDGEKPPQEKVLKSKLTLNKWKSFPAGSNNGYRCSSRSKKWSKDIYSDILQIDGNPLPKLPEEEEAIGIITMEDVIEELLQVDYYYNWLEFVLCSFPTIPYRPQSSNWSIFLYM